MPYVAVINVPGYLPESEPVEFHDASEAWKYLANERVMHEDDFPDWNGGEYSETVEQLKRLAADPYALDCSAHLDGTGVVIGKTPGHESAYDLGLAYCVGRS